MMLGSLLMPVLFLVSGVFDTLCITTSCVSWCLDVWESLCRVFYLGMRSMFSIFGYYFAQAIVGLSPIEFGDTPFV